MAKAAFGRCCPLFALPNKAIYSVEPTQTAHIRRKKNLRPKFILIVGNSPVPQSSGKRQDHMGLEGTLSNTRRNMAATVFWAGQERLF